jgi:hypothetical protein
MEQMNLSEIILPNINIEAWLRCYGTGKKADLGLEFMTAVKDGFLSHVPGIERYALPDFVTPRDLEDTVRENMSKERPDHPELERLIEARVRRNKKNWKAGTRPDSLRGIDQLREHPESEFFVDLLRPVSYNGTEISVSGIPYSHPVVPALAYLTASIINGGCIFTKKTKGGGAIYPPDNRRKVHNKIKDCVTNKPEGENYEHYYLKSAYARLLNLVGTAGGPLVNVDFEELGVCYIQRTMQYLEQGLSGKDKEHALNIIKRFIEGVTDHKLEERSKNLFQIRTARFKKEETALKFGDFLKDALRLAYPDQDYRIGEKLLDEYKGKKYYTSTFIIPKEGCLITNT